MPMVVSNFYPAIGDDRKWFRLNPSRIYRARSYIAGEFGGDSRLIFFASDGRGSLCELNGVIVKRLVGYRIRLPMFMSFHLVDDRSIVDFLRSRGVDPDTMRPHRPVIRL